LKSDFTKLNQTQFHPLRLGQRSAVLEVKTPNVVENCDNVLADTACCTPQRWL